ncbi:tyrosine-type recombinase/integrase [Methylobacterium sp. 22177]|uniref:tyrosine-type recombinase/integrase n=1 Tax=Methylobacterium sp. 22177 TaxID=3453885 RepID=UPI003F84B1D4
MPRKPDPKNAYLEVHCGYYRVSMGVPAPLRRQLGTRLKKALGTKSLLSANVLKVPVVKAFQARIARAWEIHGGDKGSVLREAAAWAETLRAAGGTEAYDDFAREIAERKAEIELTNASKVRVYVEDEGWVDHEVPTREAKEAAKLFSAVVHGSATPIALHHEDFMKTLNIKPRSRTDDPRALKVLLDWCVAKNVPPYLENIDELTALRFMDGLPQFTGAAWATNNKHLGRLKLYWKWMKRRQMVKVNSFWDLNLPKPDTDPETEERAFLDVEVQKLLMGTKDPAMLDVMMIAALTGARLDAIIDLRVGDSIDGWFTFKPQKKEKKARDVPIHPALREIVLRRAKGRAPEDEFFPEWPGPKSGTSMRERSADYSKHFMRYRIKVGVQDNVPGKRRSLVNFHSFRRWFSTKAERSGTSGDMIAAIVGHKRSGLTLGRYSEGPEMEAAKVAVAKVQLPPLDGSPVREAQALTPRRRRVAGS